MLYCTEYSNTVIHADPWAVTPVTFTSYSGYLYQLPVGAFGTLAAMHTGSDTVSDKIPANT